MSFDRLDNTTPMSVHAELLDDRLGGEVLTVIAKMTWAVSPAGEPSIATPQVPVRELDEWPAEPGEGSLRYPSDLSPEKPGTDVLLVGTAHPPSDRVVTSHDVRLRVETARGPLLRGVRVYGPRVYYAALSAVAPGPPGPLHPTPLVYELAYGGFDGSDPERPLIDERNPIGSGVARDRNSLVGKPAPAIEDLEHPLSSRSPLPGGFGPIPAHWAPRSHFAGTFDDTWRRERAPLAPADRDPRFYCAAPQGLWLEDPLRGDEPIEVLGATREGAWRFRLPFYQPVFTCVTRGVPRAHATHLDTLLIDADAGQVELTFRVSIPAPRKLQAIELVRIEGRPPLPEHLIPEARTRDERAS